MAKELNLRWYKGEDSYSDGDAEENAIYDIISRFPAEQYEQAIIDEFSWPTFYHLTHIRRNILNWYEFKESSDILEIGCGMGAITGVLCESGANVTAVELSKRRASCALKRNSRFDNLEIIVGNLNDIEFEKKFDYITLIGVLEYQGTFTDGEDPYYEFICNIKKLLKPDGKLLIAIENRFGLKYFCGTMEDHTGVPFDGINDYKLSGRKVRTFSRNELKELVERCGLNNTYFWYPLPDYKLPTAIFSDDRLPDRTAVKDIFNYRLDPRTLVAREYDLYPELIDNNVFPFFANSFLLECSAVKTEHHVSYASCTSSRTDEYRTITRLRGKRGADKISATPTGDNSHLREMLENEEYLASMGIDVLRSNMNNGVLSMDYIDCPTVMDRIRQLNKSKDKDGIFKLTDAIYEDIIKSSEVSDSSANMIYELGIDSPDSGIDYGRILKYGFVDMTAQNAFICEGGLKWYDQEWKLENVPAKYIMFRCIQMLYAYIGENALCIKLNEFLDRYSISERENNESYMKLLKNFNSIVLDENWNKTYMRLVHNEGQFISAAIRRLVP